MNEGLNSLATVLSRRIGDHKVIDDRDLLDSQWWPKWSKVQNSLDQFGAECKMDT